MEIQKKNSSLIVICWKNINENWCIISDFFKKRYFFLAQRLTTTISVQKECPT